MSQALAGHWDAVYRIVADDQQERDERLHLDQATIVDDPLAEHEGGRFQSPGDGQQRRKHEGSPSIRRDGPTYLPRDIIIGAGGRSGRAAALDDSANPR